MKENIKQKGFIRTPLLIGIIASILVIGGLSFSLLEHRRVSGTLIESQHLTELESYGEAIGLLEGAQTSWLVASFGIKDAEIQEELEEIETRQKHKEIYKDGLDASNEARWEEAIDTFVKIPVNSFYYHQSQFKIEEIEKKIIEEELEEERTARQVAEEDARKEAEKRVAEELERKAAEAREEEERLAREEKEREAETQKQRAEQQEKEKVLELARIHPLIRGIISGELKFYIEPVPAYAAYDVSEAISIISEMFSDDEWWWGELIAVRRVYNPNDADIVITWIKNYGGEVLGEAIFQSHIKVGLGAENCLGEWRVFDSPTVATILWHELGHAMGYGHSADPNNVMYPTLDIHFEVEQEISKVIPDDYYYSTPLCKGGTYYYSFETDSPYTGFDLYVIPPGQSPLEISVGSGQYYPDCSKESAHKYADWCTVPRGAQIYIGNASPWEAIHLNGEIIYAEPPPVPDLFWDPDAFQYDINELQEYWDLFHGE